MQGVTEWTFTADVAKWVEQILIDRPDLPFSRTSVEDRSIGSQKRRDFTLYLKNGNAFLTGEMKMPDKADGGSPYREAVVKDAHDKADNAGVEYFFTWNVNRCVLWKTFEVGKPIISRHIEDYSNIPTFSYQTLLRRRASSGSRTDQKVFVTVLGKMRCTNLWCEAYDDVDAG